MNTIRRKIGFHVDPDGSVSPAIPQYGGVKGEHNVTTLSMTLSASAPYCEGDLVRLRFAGGDGSVLSSDLITDYIVQDGRMVVSYALPAVLTRVGGQLGVRLVLSAVDENGTETETFLSSEAVLYFDEAPTENGTPFWTGVSEMLKRTTAASDAAAAARDAARDHGETASAEAVRAERFSEAASANAVRATDAEKNAQLYASAAMSARDQAEEAKGATAVDAAKANNAAQKIADSAAQIDKNAANILSLTQIAYSLQSQKLQKSGHTPNMYLGTDTEGNVVVKESPVDKAELVQAVIESIGVPVFGTVGEDKTITLSEELPEGVYTLRYLSADGYADIGTITVGSPAPEVVNLVPTALAHTDLTTVYDGKGYKDNTRASTSTPFTSAQDGYVTVGAIPVGFDTVLYIKGVTIPTDDTNVRFAFCRAAAANPNEIGVYVCSNAPITSEQYCTFETLGEQYYKVTFNEAYLQENCIALEYFFFSAVGTGENLIVATTPIE